MALRIDVTYSPRRQEITVFALKEDKQLFTLSTDEEDIDVSHKGTIIDYVEQHYGDIITDLL